MPCPRTSRVPENTYGRPSLPGRAGMSVGARTIRLRTGADSRVSKDSSVCSSRASISVASAGRVALGQHDKVAPHRLAARDASAFATTEQEGTRTGQIRSRKASSTRSLRVSCTAAIATDRQANPSRSNASNASPSGRYIRPEPSRRPNTGSAHRANAQRPATPGARQLVGTVGRQPGSGLLVRQTLRDGFHTGALPQIEQTRCKGDAADRHAPSPLRRLRQRVAAGSAGIGSPHRLPGFHAALGPNPGRPME